MMTTQKLSKYRQKLRELIKQIDTQAFKAAHKDNLIQGTPGLVFRTCGKKSCKCFNDPEKRHGPYFVIQVFKNGKQKQVALKKSQKDIWLKSKNYQVQKRNLSDLKESMKQLDELVKEIINQRTEEFST